ncbi:hypothetical protein AB0G05_29350 [Nonomuraea wenchangensis]
MPRIDRSIAAAAVPALLGWSLCGCAAQPTGPPAPLPVRSVTSSPPDAAEAGTSEPETTFPSPLVGLWESTGQGNALLVYKFDEDGTYRHAGVLNQQRPSGVFSFEIAVKGQAEADGETLVLRPAEGTKTLRDPDSPSGSYRDRPMDDLSPERYSWRLADDVLVLTSGSGEAVSYKRSG